VDHQSGSDSRSALAGIRHVDSVLAVFLAITIFETNTILGITSLGVVEKVRHIIYIVLYTLPGVVGILRQSWPLRFFSWEMTLYSLLSNFSRLIFLFFKIPGTWYRIILIREAMPLMISTLIFWHAVRYAYLHSLRTNRSSVVQREIEHYSSVVLWVTPLSVVGILLEFLVTGRV
jgi:hypothetical protein